MPYQLQISPTVISTNDEKLIEEHEGPASTGNKNICIARMIAPPAWREPFQKLQFQDNMVSKGKKMVEVDEQADILEAGESILIKPGTRVRYSNPFNEECEYWSVCLPAFSIETVHREES